MVFMVRVQASLFMLLVGNIFFGDIMPPVTLFHGLVVLSQHLRVITGMEAKLLQLTLMLLLVFS